MRVILSNNENIGKNTDLFVWKSRAQKSWLMFFSRLCLTLKLTQFIRPWIQSARPKGYSRRSNLIIMQYFSAHSLIRRRFHGKCVKLSSLEVSYQRLRKFIWLCTTKKKLWWSQHPLSFAGMLRFCRFSSNFIQYSEEEKSTNYCNESRRVLFALDNILLIRCASIYCRHPWASHTYFSLERAIEWQQIERPRWWSNISE